MPWEGPSDPTATSRYYVTIKQVQPPLPYAAGDVILRASAAACLRYSAVRRMLPSDVALVSFLSSLEGLFTTASDNISYRFALAIGFFLGDTRDERNDLIEAAKRVYTARSKTVHGAQIAS